MWASFLASCFLCAGSPQAQRIMIARQGNLAHKKQLAKKLAHIQE